MGREVRGEERCNLQSSSSTQTHNHRVGEGEPGMESEEGVVESGGMGSEVEGTIPMGVCETQLGRPLLFLPLSSILNFFSVLEYFLAFLYRRHSLSSVIYGGQEKPPLCCRATSCFGLTLRKQPLHRSSELGFTHGLHTVVHDCARVHFYEEFGVYSRGSDSEGDLNRHVRTPVSSRMRSMLNCK